MLYWAPQLATMVGVDADVGVDANECVDVDGGVILGAKMAHLQWEATLKAGK